MRRIEAGNTNPPALPLRRIAAGLGVPLTDLLGFPTGEGGRN